MTYLSWRLRTLSEWNHILLGQHSWKKAEMTHRLDERSYEVLAAGTSYRCNRQHLLKTPWSQVIHDPSEKSTPEADHLPFVHEPQHLEAGQAKHQAEEKKGANPVNQPCNQPEVKRYQSGGILTKPANWRTISLPEQFCPNQISDISNSLLQSCLSAIFIDIWHWTVDPHKFFTLFSNFLYTRVKLDVLSSLRSLSPNIPSTTAKKCVLHFSTNRTSAWCLLQILRNMII